MAKKQYSPEPAVAKLKRVDTLVGEGTPIQQACSGNPALLADPAAE